MENIDKKASLFGKKGQQVKDNKPVFAGGKKKKEVNNPSAPRPGGQPPKRTVMKSAARGR